MTSLAEKIAKLRALAANNPNAHEAAAAAEMADRLEDGAETLPEPTVDVVAFDRLLTQDAVVRSMFFPGPDESRDMLLWERHPWPGEWPENERGTLLVALATVDGERRIIWFCPGCEKRLYRLPIKSRPMAALGRISTGEDCQLCPDCAAGRRRLP